MPGATPIHAIPTMLDTDPMADVALSIRALANDLDGIGLSGLAAGSGWAGIMRFWSASNVVTVQMGSTKSSWAANELIGGGIPAAYRPPSDLYYPALTVTTGVTVWLKITTAGDVRAVAAAAAGAGGVFAAMTYCLAS